MKLNLIRPTFILIPIAIPFFVTPKGDGNYTMSREILIFGIRIAYWTVMPKQII